MLISTRVHFFCAQIKLWMLAPTRNYKTVNPQEAGLTNVTSFASPVPFGIHWYKAISDWQVGKHELCCILPLKLGVFCSLTQNGPSWMLSKHYGCQLILNTWDEYSELVLAVKKCGCTPAEKEVNRGWNGSFIRSHSGSSSKQAVIVMRHLEMSQ